MTPERFVSDLARFHFASAFNPYSDHCPVHDAPNAPALRRHNLTNYLTGVLEMAPSTVWLGRDFGYRGGRRTGIALTDEFHLENLQQRMPIKNLVRATVGPVVKERTATEVWKAINLLSQPPVLWNVFPFHPFEEGDYFSNRSHTRSEFKSCSGILSVFLNWLKPKIIIALGADAHRAATGVGFDCILVRHPSYGGQADFAKGIRKVCG
jgi:uracil-DNA glycosylase